MLLFELKMSLRTNFQDNSESRKYRLCQESHESSVLENCVGDFEMNCMYVIQISEEAFAWTT